MPPITMGAFFQKFVVAIFEKRRGCLGADLCASELSAAANPTKKHGRVFTATQRCLQIAEDICYLITANIVITRRRVLPAQGLFPNRGTRFLPTLCETFFVHIISKVILRLYPSRRAPGQRCLQIAEDICCLITANIGILHPQGHSATLIMRYPYNVR